MGEARTTLGVFQRTTNYPFTRVDQSEHHSYRRAARRLRGAARWYIIGYSVAHLLSEFVRHGLEGKPYDFDAVYWIVAVFIGISLVVDRLARPGPLNLDQLIGLGLIYEVVAALGIGLGIHADQTAVSRVWGVSWIAVWVVMYPLVLPSTATRTAVASFAAAAMDPLAIVLWSTLGGHEAPPGSMIFAMVWPTFLCAGLASLGSQVIFHLRAEQDRARLLGTYLLEEKVGEGGMGEVWKARHEMLVRPSAIKLIRRDRVSAMLTKQRLLRRFEREAQATAWLTSPHTVELFDFGTTTEGDLYYVMEFLQGVNLQEAVETFGPFSSARVAHILVQACSSLAEAHHKGLIHRDVKPANIFICHVGLEFDYVKVVDFGLVKPRHRDLTGLTDPRTITGTPSYMAPESLQGLEIDERADIYCLGCVAYWLVSGVHAFEGDNPLQLALRHVEDEVEPPSTRTEVNVHEDLEKIILDCLSKRPADRPRSCERLQERLRDLGLEPRWTSEHAARWWQNHLPGR